MRGERDEALRAFGRWIEVADGAGLSASKLQGLMELGNVEFMTTYVPDRLRETRMHAREAGAYPTLVLADLSLVWCLGATGDLTDATTIGEEALDLARRFELDLLPHVIQALAWAHGRRSHGAGDALLHEAVGLAPEDADILAQAYDAWADWQVRAGRFEEALRNLDRSVEIMLSNPEVVPLVAPAKRAIALIALRRRDEAAAALEQARRFVEKPRLLIVRMWFDAAIAMLERSPNALERAVPANTAAAYERATLLSLGAQLIGGDGALGWLGESLAVFEQAGAEDDAARTRRLLRERGAPVPRARRKTAAVPDPLRARGVTRREAEVLQLVGSGLSNAEIAEKFFLSVRTVESHVSTLLRKLQVETRAALIATALQLAPSGRQ
jgi:ATP/maltotriose-dependent transcriptional regulator MalT